MPKLKVTFFIDDDLVKGLNVLSKYTRVNKSEYIREGIKMVLDKYRKEVMYMDVSKMPFNELAPTYRRLLDEGKIEEAKEFDRKVKKEFTSLNSLIKEARSSLTRKTERS